MAWAYDHAAAKIQDLTTTSGSEALGAMAPSDALSAITGLAATGDDIKSSDQLWTALGQAQAHKTPVVLQTQPGATTLLHSHAYAVLYITDSDGDQMYAHPPCSHTTSDH